MIRKVEISTKRHADAAPVARARRGEGRIDRRCCSYSMRAVGIMPPTCRLKIGVWRCSADPVVPCRERQDAVYKTNTGAHYLVISFFRISPQAPGVPNKHTGWLIGCPRLVWRGNLQGFCLVDYIFRSAWCSF